MYTCMHAGVAAEEDVVAAAHWLRGLVAAELDCAVGSRGLITLGQLEEALAGVECRGMLERAGQRDEGTAAVRVGHTDESRRCRFDHSALIFFPRLIFVFPLGALPPYK